MTTTLKLRFRSKVWKSGDRFFIRLPSEAVAQYELLGKDVLVIIEPSEKYAVMEK
ncbi:hypothetical protein KKG24_04805 [Patescibacteria group bacterium]|nr:hypothetical protein [Patescibacteria group bacterium]